LRKLQFLEYRRNEGTEKIEKIVEIENIEELENLVLFSSLPIDGSLLFSNCFVSLLSQSKI
jgi:hypothetical protein